MAASPTEVVIYGLSCPITGACRYIGKANNMKKRLASHIRDSRRRNTPLYSWIRKLALQGLQPSIGVIAIVPASQWPAREKDAISHAFQMGANLLNLAPGGDEPACSLETRQNNGKLVSKLRTSTPLKKRVYEIKQRLGQEFARGQVTAEIKEKVRYAVNKRPDLFGSLSKWL